MNSDSVWSMADWSYRTSALRERILRTTSEPEAMSVAAGAARQVLKAYSTSFYLVTRFLPPVKRRQVELIYAAVRYPDELVDTFYSCDLDVAGELANWEQDYVAALESSGLCESAEAGLHPVVSAFAEVVKKRQIPSEYYISFLAAMRSDLTPQSFNTIDELIDGYIYGSATVVGYFLTYVYKTENPEDFDRALGCARDLAIALQLTNFARDVSDDYYRGRIYAPLDMLGVDIGSGVPGQVNRPDSALDSARLALAKHASLKYEAARRNLHLFSKDSRVAIECCINVYSLLNQRIIEARDGLDDRPSVPWLSKFAALPPSKYWRVPLSLAGFM